MSGQLHAAAVLSRGKQSQIKVKVKLSLRFLTEYIRNEGVLGSGGKINLFFDVGTRWRCVVSFSLPGRFTP